MREMMEIDEKMKAHNNKEKKRLTGEEEGKRN